MTVVVPDLHTAATQARASRSPTIPSLGGRARSANLLEDNDGWIDGKFRLLDKLGEGGFGLVYKAEQVQPIHRLVAVKILKAGMDTQQVIARFDTERQSLALMEHPNIARVLDAGETERGQPYFVMELVRGRSITSYAREKKLSLRRRIELFIPVCQAVNHAHQKGIIHRDLKPSNVMVMEEDGVPVPKVIDFGIAKVLEQKNVSDTLMTGMDQLVGTPGYISPEQIEHGSSHVDTRSDVYALGSILLELLSGRGLVSAADLANRPLHQILRDQVEVDPPRPSSREPALKGDLDWIILKALERDPARRYGNADDLADDLRRYLHDQPVRACPPSRGYLIQKFVRRHRVGVSAAAAVALAVLIGAVTSTLLYLESEKNRLAARKASSVSDGRMAAQLQNADPPDHHSATALLCRALRTDPGNTEAATNLLSLLEHGHLIQPATPELSLPPGVIEARLIAVSRQADRVLAVSKPAGGGREILSLWNMTTGQRQDHELPPDVLATVLLVSKDGSLAFLARDDGQVMRWRLNDNRHDMMSQRMPAGPDGTVQSVLSMTESGDGRTLAAGGDNGSILVWNVGRPEAPARLLSHPTPQGGRTPILSLAMDYLGTIAATASNSNGADGGGVVRGVVAVWDLLEGRILGDLVQVEEGVSAVAVHREKELLAIGLHGGGLHVLNFRALEEAVPELKHPSAVTSLSFNSDASTLVVGDGGGYLHAWDMSAGRPRFPAQRHDGEIMALASSPESGVFVSVSRHGEVQVWDSTNGSRLGQRLRHSVVEVAMTPDASLLAMAPRYSPHVQVWRIHQRMATRRFLADPAEDLLHAPSVSAKTSAALKNAAALGWNAGRTWVAAADAAGRVQVLRAADGRPMGPAVEHPPAVGAVALSGDGRLLVTSGRDQEVRFWDAQSGGATGMVIRFDAFVSALALSQDGARLVTVTDDGEARVWDTADGVSLAPPFRLGAGVDALFVRSDAKGFVYRLPEAGWFELPMPAQAPLLPGWFLDLAEAQARRRLTPEGRTDALTLKDWQNAVKAVPAAASGGEDVAHRWARWLLTEPPKRALSPGDDEPLAAYLEALEKRGSQAARAELDRFRMELAK
jgi:serine/threonine protein kinase/WD40 repeat protein